MSEKQKNIKIVLSLMDCIKANRKGNRDAELENSTGFRSVHKIHESKKVYTRKMKHKNNEI